MTENNFYCLRFYVTYRCNSKCSYCNVWKDEIFATVAHEFTHHMEETAGLHALDDADAEFLRQAIELYGDQ